MPDILLFDLIQLLLSIIASIIFSYVCKKRKDLMTWLPAYYSVTIAYVFLSLGSIINELIYIGLIFLSIASFLIFLAVFIEYDQTFNQRFYQRKNGFHNLTAVLIPIVIFCYFFLAGVLLLSMLLLLRIYFRKRTPSHAFLCLSLFGAFLNSLSTIIGAYGYETALILKDTIAVFFLTIFIMTGIVALIENRIISSETDARKAVDRAIFYRDLFLHDMNNILQNINSSIELFSIHNKNPEKVKNIDEIIAIAKEQVKRGAKLGENVRKLTQIEKGASALKAINPKIILEKVIDYLKKSYANKNLSIETDYPNKEFNIRADNLLRDVFENILINAINHNDNPKIEIKIKISEIALFKKKYLKIEFIDNGNGIPDELKERIFNIIDEKSYGLSRKGLGLSLVKQIINQYYGKIWVNNRVERDHTLGSVFVLLIPILKKNSN